VAPQGPAQVASLNSFASFAPATPTAATADTKVSIEADIVGRHQRAARGERADGALVEQDGGIGRAGYRGEYM